MDEPTLADDEAALAAYASVLVDAVSVVAASWIERLILLRAPELAGAAEVDRASGEGAATIVAELRTLLERDISEQAIGPLEVLRRGVRFPTAVLRSAEVAPVARDEFAMRAFPEDLYDLTPASFGAVDPSLHEPGLMWGAAKAHVHLRRRREDGAVPGTF